MRAGLEARIAELSLEIRHYPTPIARCDEQLAHLISLRAELLAQQDARAARPIACPPLAVWANDGGSTA